MSIPSNPTIYRKDSRLLVPRGADISSACLACGKAPVGGPIRRRLAGSQWITHKAVAGGGSGMFWLDVIEFVLSAIWFVVDFPARRKRLITIGFCGEHRRKYVLFRRGGRVCLVVGLALFIAAFAHIPDPWDSIMGGVGVVLFMTGIFLPYGAPAIKLFAIRRRGCGSKGRARHF